MSASGLLIGMCLGFASCGAPPEEEAPPESQAQALMSCNQCTPKNCNERCDLPGGGVSQCTHHVVWCEDPNGGFEIPKDPPPSPPPPVGPNPPENWCANTNFRSCRDVGNWRLIRQYVKRECDGFPGAPGPGSTGQCRNAVYDVWSTEQTASDCKNCPCRFVTQRRCANGRIVGGDWGVRGGLNCYGAGPDRAVCN